MHLFQSSCNVGFKFVWRNTFYPREKEQVLLNRKLVPKQIELWTDSNLQLNNFELRFDIEAANPSVSVSWWIESRELRNQRRFASSVRTKQSKELTGLNLKANVFVGYLRCSSINAWVYLSYVFSYQRIV